MHPHSGQGANLALEDAVALGDAIAAADVRAPVPARRLAGRARAARRAAMVVRSAIAAKTLDAPNAAWRLMRHGTFEAGRIGPVRRAMLAQQAGVGITG